jgi:putative methyltransferase
MLFLRQITALEQAPDRYKTLVQQLKRAGSLRHDSPGAVRAIQCDFTKQKGDDFSDVTHMLLDPSCSGSGILSRLDYLTNSNEEEQTEGQEEKEQERLRSLAAFQGNMITHAMQQFPSLRRFVYSTCSIHHEENESVVTKALASDIAKSRGWKLAPRREVIDTWETRGMVDHCNGNKELADSMIRCVPGGLEREGVAAEDGSGIVDLGATNGFFLACFVRKSNNNAKNKKRNARAREKAKGAKRARVDRAEDSIAGDSNDDDDDEQ